MLRVRFFPLTRKKPYVPHFLINQEEEAMFFPCPKDFPTHWFGSDKLVHLLTLLHAHLSDRKQFFIDELNVEIVVSFLIYGRLEVLQELILCLRQFLSRVIGIECHPEPPRLRRNSGSLHNKSGRSAGSRMTLFRIDSFNFPG